MVAHINRVMTISGEKMDCCSKKKDKIWPLIILLLTSVDTVLFGTNGNRLFLYIPRIIAVLFIVYEIFMVRRVKLYLNKSFVIMFLLSSITIASGLYNGTKAETVISRVLPVLVGYCIAEAYGFRYFVDAFEKVLYPLACISLVVYGICAIVPIIIQSLPSFSNENDLRIYTVGFCSVLSNVGLRGFLSRMSSIFWEPGAYAIYLCLGLLFHCFYSKQVEIKRIVIYCLGVVTTFSTTGIIGLIEIMLVYILVKKDHVNHILKTLASLFMVSILSFFIFASESVLYNTYFSKIFNREGTAITRYSSTINGLQIALEHPLLGLGRQTETEMVRNAIASGYGRNSMITNTVVHQFANYGMVFGAIFTICTFLFFWKSFSNARILAIGLFLVLMTLYYAECFFSFLPFVFVFYGLKYENGKRMCKERQE